MAVELSCMSGFMHVCVCVYLCLDFVNLLVRARVRARAAHESWRMMIAVLSRMHAV